MHTPQATVREIKCFSTCQILSSVSYFLPCWIEVVMFSLFNMRPGDRHRDVHFIRFFSSFYDCSAAAHLCHEPFCKNNENTMKQSSFGIMKQTDVMIDSLRKCHSYSSKKWEGGEELFFLFYLFSCCLAVFGLDMSLYLKATQRKSYFVILTRNQGNQEAFPRFYSSLVFSFYQFRNDLFYQL